MKTNYDKIVNESILKITKFYMKEGIGTDAFNKINDGVKGILGRKDLQGISLDDNNKFIRDYNKNPIGTTLKYPTRVPHTPQQMADMNKKSTDLASYHNATAAGITVAISGAIYLFIKWMNRAKQAAQKAPSGQKRKTYQAVKKTGAVHALRQLEQDKNKIKSAKDQRAHDTVKKGLIKVIKREGK